MSYKIELIPSGVSGARPTMFRGGQKFEVGTPQILDLTEEQAEVFKNDWRFKVSDSKDTGSKVAGGAPETSKNVSSAGSASAEEEPLAEVETVEDSAVAPQEADSGEDEDAWTVEGLCRDYSRDGLNALAKELGAIENPEDFANKTEVAQAIIDAS